MIVNVNVIPEAELDYWAKSALVQQLINEQKALNNFLTNDEADELFAPDEPVMVEYDESDEVMESGDEIIDIENNTMVLEKSFKSRLLEKIQRIGGK